MDWKNERYVRIYTRDTKTWKLLGWEGQTVLCLLARRFDRSGVLDDVSTGEDVALMIGSGFPIDVAERGLERLLKPSKQGESVWMATESGLLWPKFMEAQETSMSDAQRQRESRAKRRAKEAFMAKRRAKEAFAEAVVDNDVTNRDQNPEKCHAATAPVTPCLTVLNRTVPKKKTPPIVPPRGESLPQDFEAFWQEYPKKTGKRQALRAWKNAKSRGLPSVDELKAILGRQKTWRAWLEGYVCNPATWLNGDRWKDEEPPAPRSGRVASTQGSIDFLRRKMEE